MGEDAMGEFISIDALLVDARTRWDADAAKRVVITAGRMAKLASAETGQTITREETYAQLLEMTDADRELLVTTLGKPKAERADG